MSLIRNNHNKYDIYLLLLIVSTIFGGIGGALAAPRLLVILLIPQLFSTENIENLNDLSSLRSWCFAFYVFALVSMLWTPNNEEGFKELVYYLVHFLIFFEVIVFSREALCPLQFIAIGFALCVLLTSVVGFWELTTDNHLAYSQMDEAKASNVGGEIVLRKFAAVTFYNLNGYVTYLCFCLPFLLYGFSLEEKLLKWMSFIALIIAIVLILCNASRGGMFTIVICLAVFFLMSQKNKSLIYSFIVLIGGLLYILYKYGDSILFILTNEPD